MRRWGFALLACLAASSPAIAYADPTAAEANARRLFEEGKELEDKGDFAAALAKYAAAEASFSTAGVVFHKGFCLEMTGKLRDAIDAYERALAAAKAEGKAAVERATAARLDPLRARVPVIVVRIGTNVDGLVVKLDGAPLDKPRLAGQPIRVEPGNHDVTATAPGHASFAKQVRSHEGSSVTVDVVLEAQPQPQATIEPPRASGRAPSYAVPLATTIGTVLFAGVGVATFVLAGAAASDADASCPTKVSCDDERRKVRALDAVALGSIIGAVGLGTLSVILWSTRPSASGAVTRFVATPSALGVQGSF